MSYWPLLPFILGMATVIQGALNRQIGEHWGPSSAVFLNAFILFTFTGALFAFAQFFPALCPEFLRVQPERTFKSWYLIPGLCGILILIGLPWSMRHLGANRSFVLVITAQIITGILMDVWVLHKGIDFKRGLGALITLLGAALSVLG